MKTSQVKHKSILDTIESGAARRHAFAARLLVIALAISLSKAMAQELVFRAEQDFSPSLNPNGAWTYGWTAGLGSALSIFDQPGTVFTNYPHPFEYWTRASIMYPILFHNPHQESVTNDNLYIPPGGLDLHPGGTGELAVVRWTAPSAGTASIQGAFTANDVYHPPTSDIHVLHNGVPIFDGAITNFFQTAPFSKSVVLAAKDTIDFAVGWGSNHQYGYDNTGLSARVAFTPLLLSIRVSQVEICWDTVTNASYQVQYSSALTPNDWVPITADWLQGNGSRMCAGDAVAAGQAQRFYRVAITNWPASGL